MARTKQTARKSTGGKAPRKVLASKAAQAFSGFGSPLGTFGTAAVPTEPATNFTLKSYKGGMINPGRMGRRRRFGFGFGAGAGASFDEVVANVPVVHPFEMPPGDGDEARAARAESHVSAYAASYSAIPDTDGAARAALLASAVQDENEFRKTFAQDRENAALDDPYLMMIPVHRHEDIFKCSPPAEPAIPLVCDLGENRKPAGAPAVVSKEEFSANFDVFTEGLLTHLNWDNVFAAGGCVLAALTPVPEEYAESDQRKREYYHQVAYKNSDIDLFIYGLSEEEANDKLQEIYFKVCERTMPLANTICFRSKHSISIVSQFPYRHVQIILRLYKSPAEVLMGFDVDSCSVGFDGSNVWMTPRCHHALVAQANTIDMTRRSPTYEQRLAKYAARGFAIEVPNLDRSKIDPQIFERRFDSVKGLAKLLLLERLSTPEARHLFKEQQRLRHLRPTYEKQGAYYNIIQHSFANDTYLTERIEETQLSPSDYSCVFLPWGPAWNASKIRKLMYTKDVLLNSDMFGIGKPKRHRHPCFFGTLEEVLGDCCGECPEDEGEEDTKDDDFVHGELAWLATNPGQQSIGSFHPITTGDWTEGAYVNEVTEDLVLAVATGKEGEVEACLARPGANPNAKDVTGRTPLMIAAFTNNVSAARTLLAAGAFVSERLQDGRTALHIAAAYGHHEIVALILEQGKIANRLLEEQIEREREEERRRKEEEEGENEGEEEEEEYHDSDWYRKQYYKRRREEEKEAKRRAELDEKRAMDRMEIDKEDFDHRMSPLMYAVFFGWTECARLLIDSGADLTKSLTYQSDGRDTCTYPLLHLACINNQLAVAQLLLEKGTSLDAADHEGNTALHKAVQLQRTELLQLLCTFSGQRPLQRTATPFPGQSVAFQQAMLNEHFFTSGLPASAFVDALKKMARPQALDVSPEGNVPNKASVNWLNNNRQTPLLYLLAKHPTTETAPALADILIAAGAAVQITEDHIREHKQRTGMHLDVNSVQQPVHVAAQAGATEVLKRLLAANADVNAISSSSGNTQFRGFGKRSRHGFNGAVFQTPLDCVNARLRELQEGVEQKIHVTGREFLDFLLAKTTPGTFKHLTLTRMLEQHYTGKNTLTNASELLNAQSEEEKREKQEERRKERERYAACRALLVDAKGLPFGDLKFPEDDPNNYRAHQRRGNQRFVGGEVKPAYTIGVDPQAPFGGIAFQEVFRGIPEENNFGNTDIPEHLQPRYAQLFDAIVAGDIATIRALTLDCPNEEDRLVVCVMSTLCTPRTTLQVAMECNRPEVVAALIDIAVKQYTPRPAKEDDDSDSVSSGGFQINNIDLASAAASSDANVRHLLMSMMGQAKATKATPKRRTPQPNPVTGAAPSTDPVKLICTVSPTQFVVISPSNSPSALTVGVQTGNVEAVRSLFDSIGAHGLKLKGRSGEVPLVTALLRCDDGAFRPLIYNDVKTPFELAMRFDQVEVAKLLLSRGAIDCLALEEEWLLKTGETAAYEGLSVGGQKVEDHLASHVRLARAFRLQHRLTGLHIAAAYNSLNAISFLLGAETDGYIIVDFDESWETTASTKAPLFSLAQRNEHGQTALHIAVINNHPQALQRLLQLGQEQLGPEGLKSVIDITRAPQPTESDPTNEIEIAGVLALAVTHDTQECTELLLSFGANPMAAFQQPGLPPGESPLHVAIRNCNAPHVAALLQAKADVSAPGPHLWNSLHYLVKAKERKTKAGKLLTPKAVTELLLAAESSKAAIAGCSDVGETPLMVAAQHSLVELVNAFLASGADPAVRDSNGKTALHHAAKANSKECVEALLHSKPPFVNAEDYFGHTPLDWLMRNMSRQLATAGQTAANDALNKLQDVHGTSKREIVPPSAVRSVTITAVEGLERKEKERQQKMKKQKQFTHAFALKAESESDCEF